MFFGIFYLSLFLLSCSSVSNNLTTTDNVGNNPDVIKSPTPLMNILIQDPNNIDGVKELLQSDQIDTISIYNGQTAYEMTDNEEIKAEIVKYNNDILLSDAQEGNTTRIPYLGRAGVNVNHQDADKNTALHYATKANDNQLIAAINSIKDTNTRTKIKTRNEENTDSITNINLIPNPNILNNDGETAFTIAVKHESVSALNVVSVLIEMGADTLIQEDNEYPYNLAANEGVRELIANHNSRRLEDPTDEINEYLENLSAEVAEELTKISVLETNTTDNVVVYTPINIKTFGINSEYRNTNNEKNIFEKAIENENIILISTYLFNKVNLNVIGTDNNPLFYTLYQMSKSNNELKGIIVNSLISNYTNIKLDPSLKKGFIDEIQSDDSLRYAFEKYGPNRIIFDINNGNIENASNLLKTTIFVDLLVGSKGQEYFINNILNNIKDDPAKLNQILDNGDNIFTYFINKECKIRGNYSNILDAILNAGIDLSTINEDGLTSYEALNPLEDLNNASDIYLLYNNYASHLEDNIHIAKTKLKYREKIRNFNKEKYSNLTDIINSNLISQGIDTLTNGQNIIDQLISDNNQDLVNIVIDNNNMIFLEEVFSDKVRSENISNYYSLGLKHDFNDYAVMNVLRGKVIDESNATKVQTLITKLVVNKSELYGSSIVEVIPKDKFLFSNSSIKFSQFIIGLQMTEYHEPNYDDAVRMLNLLKSISAATAANDADQWSSGSALMTRGIGSYDNLNVFTGLDGTLPMFVFYNCLEDMLTNDGFKDSAGVPYFNLLEEGNDGKTIINYVLNKDVDYKINYLTDEVINIPQYLQNYLINFVTKKKDTKDNELLPAIKNGLNINLKLFNNLYNNEIKHNLFEHLVTYKKKVPIELLEEYGFDFSYKDYQSNGLLHIILKKNELYYYSQEERTLLFMGMNIKALNDNKKTPYEEINSSENVAKSNSDTFINNFWFDILSAPDNDTDQKVVDAMIIRLRMLDSTKIFYIIPHCVNNEGKNIIMIASEKGYYLTLQLIMDIVTNKKLVPQLIDGMTPDDYYIANNVSETKFYKPLRWYYDKLGLNNINAIDGNASIHYAAINEHKDTLALLIDNAFGEEADPNIVNKEGKTALHIIANYDLTSNSSEERTNNILTMINNLLEKGIDISIKDEEGKTAMHYMASNNMEFMLTAIFGTNNSNNQHINILSDENKTILDYVTDNNLKDTLSALGALSNNDLL
jgi:ankyrin repeat protein